MTDRDKEKEETEQGPQFDEYPQLTGDEESVTHSDGDHRYQDKRNTGPIAGNNNDEEKEES